jgi:S1-C subfamily serine protease
MRTRLQLLAALFLGLSVALPVSADEGMWTFDNPPTQKLQETYGFTPTPEWLEHVEHACVNFGGGSGAFVSPDGLVITNHHVALGQLQKMSTASSRRRTPRRCRARIWNSRSCSRLRTSPPR